jgi:serine/threonine protein phosphatase 1
MHAYAIGDIHGHIDLLKFAHDRIADDMAIHGNGPIIHVGDLVDRGPDSAGVIAYLSSGIARGENWVVLKGNHDRMFARFLRDPEEAEPGLRADLAYLNPKIGGGPTLGSYGVKNASDRPLKPVYEEAMALVPKSHLEFIETLPTSFQHGDALFVHAGIRPGVALEDQIETDLLWIREPFLSDPVSHGPLIVHGHTAINAPTHYGNRLNIDSGAAYGGPLTAVVIEPGGAFHLKSSGRVALRPY